MRTSLGCSCSELEGKKVSLTCCKDCLSFEVQISSYHSNQTTDSWVKLIFTFPFLAASNRCHLCQKHERNGANQCQHHQKQTGIVLVISRDSFRTIVTLSLQTVLKTGTPKWGPAKQSILQELQKHQNCSLEYLPDSDPLFWTVPWYRKSQ